MRILQSGLFGVAEGILFVKSSFHTEDMCTDNLQSEFLCGPLEYLCVTLSALKACERALTRMNSSVIFKTTTLRKSKKRALSGVDSRVDNKITFVCEILSALKTFVWILFGMNSHVNVKMTCLLESLFTVWT